MNTVRIFLDLERKVLRKYLTQFFKMFVEGGAVTVDYVSFVMIIIL
jgi:hypothetical protein